MPLYEYLCEACGHRFETIQKFSDPPVDRCPKCGGTVHKQQSAPAFQFKGTGWYITDYAKKDAERAAKPDAAKGGSDGQESRDTKDAKGDKAAGDPGGKKAAADNSGKGSAGDATASSPPPPAAPAKSDTP